MTSPLLVGGGRFWTIKFRAGPRREPVYHAQGMAGAIDWPQGDVTKIEQPSDKNYNQWDIIAEYQASRDRATTTLTVYDTPNRSELLELARIRCAFDTQIHMGACEDPRDFNHGWQKIIVLENDYVTGYSTNDRGGLEGDSQDKMTEDLPISARSMYHILRMLYTEVAKAEVGEEVVAINVCDSITCGDCADTPSDGCSTVLALTDSAASSPGVLPQVIITTDQYGSNALIERWITAATLGEEMSDAACVGPYYVVVSAEAEEIYYASVADMKNEDETWAAVSTGIVAGAGPSSIWNYSPLASFLAADDGYVYRMANPADGLVVLDAGAATTEDLKEIDGWDMENVCAVGDNGAIVYTQDGTNFSLMTPPVGPTDLVTVAYRNQSEIWVGGDDGVLYATTDFGTNWITKNPPVTLVQVDKIVWANETVGFVAGHRSHVAHPSLAVILRTIDGGYSWYVAPEEAARSIPTAQYFNDLAVCPDEVNKLFAGGLAVDSSDGIIVKGSD